MKKNTILYFHRRKDTNEVFYVGIGNKYRPKDKKNRNTYWHNIVNKVGYDIEIVHKGLSWEEACKLEIQYIKEFGRYDLGLGNLVNMTDGGDGANGVKQSKKMVEERRQRMIGKKQSKEANIKKSKSLKEYYSNPKNLKKQSEIQKQSYINNPERAKKISQSHKGKVYTEETKKKMSISGKNKKMPDNFSETMSKITTGSKNGNSKLTEKEVLQIRKDYIPKHKEYGATALSKKYNITLSGICRIIYRKSWQHI